jgi:hypothetical protein
MPAAARLDFDKELAYFKQAIPLALEHDTAETDNVRQRIGQAQSCLVPCVIAACLVSRSPAVRKISKAKTCLQITLLSNLLLLKKT